MIGFKVAPDGSRGRMEITAEGPRGDQSVLKDLYEAIGCRTVDVVRLAERLDMWLDDDGMYTQEVNRLATLVAWSFGYQAQEYYGTVVFLGGANAAGDTIGLKEPAVKRLERLTDALAREYRIKPEEEVQQ